MAALRLTVLILATISVGLMAGVFAIYSNAIMPGLGKTDDRTFVAGFQSIDRAIINPLFLTTFLGPVFLTGLAVALQLGEEARQVLPWIVAAFALYLTTVVITVRVNVPLNDGLKAAGEVDQIDDLAAVRRRFDERRWNRWNNVRTVTTVAAFACLAWSLVITG